MAAELTYAVEQRLRFIGFVGSPARMRANTALHREQV
ncbi:hypothetical protein HDG34_005859 [Paraburkholderia sp. HC6.4b]|nr:hypothetical protein [Paraburkholderia sp. HC6.4b]MBB5450205.1 hypothetical protein [Paraburkholderia sp. Kb1A]